MAYAKVEAFVQRLCPKPQQLVIGYVSSLLGTFYLYKAFSTPAPPPKPLPAPAAVSYTEPTADNFGEWIQKEENVTSWLKAQPSK